MTDPATERGCESCRWWRRYDDDPDVGACASVWANDYGRAFIEGEGDLVTFADHFCGDWQEADE